MVSEPCPASANFQSLKLLLRSTASHFPSQDQSHCLQFDLLLSLLNLLSATSTPCAPAKSHPQESVSLSGDEPRVLSPFSLERAASSPATFVVGDSNSTDSHDNSTQSQSPDSSVPDAAKEGAYDELLDPSALDDDQLFFHVLQQEMLAVQRHFSESAAAIVGQWAFQQSTGALYVGEAPAPAPSTPVLRTVRSLDGKVWGPETGAGIIASGMREQRKAWTIAQAAKWCYQYACINRVAVEALVSKRDCLQGDGAGARFLRAQRRNCTFLGSPLLLELQAIVALQHKVANAAASLSPQSSVEGNLAKVAREGDGACQPCPGMDSSSSSLSHSSDSLGCALDKSNTLAQASDKLGALFPQDDHQPGLASTAQPPETSPGDKGSLQGPCGCSGVTETVPFAVVTMPFLCHCSMSNIPDHCRLCQGSVTDAIGLSCGCVLCGECAVDTMLSLVRLPAPCSYPEGPKHGLGLTTRPPCTGLTVHLQQQHRSSNVMGQLRRQIIKAEPLLSCPGCNTVGAFVGSCPLPAVSRLMCPSSSASSTPSQAGIADRDFLAGSLDEPLACSKGLFGAVYTLAWPGPMPGDLEGPLAGNCSSLGGPGRGNGSPKGASRILPGFVRARDLRAWQDLPMVFRE